MTTIKIQAEEELVTALKKIAKRKLTTMEALVKEALLNYLQIQPSKPKSYSFIGIGHSGKGNISKQNAKEYEKISKVFNLLKLLISAKEDVRDGHYKKVRSFFQEFKRDKKI